MGRSKLAALWRHLLSVRNLQEPTGRRLYSYRFTPEEFDEVRDTLSSHGAFVLRDAAGRALLVAFCAEWFRRKRHGGTWDWIRPLNELNIEYGSGRATVSYADVREAIRAGLSSWKRPLPQDGELIPTVVKESGFPVAALRDNKQFSRFLSRVVLMVERGISAADAIDSEAHRLPEMLRNLAAEAAELAQALVDLRRLLPVKDRRDEISAIAHLARNAPGWQDCLPFLMEDEDLSSLVETALRSSVERSDALTVTRLLVHRSDGWQWEATVTLEGLVDRTKFPRAFNERLGRDVRFRIEPRGEMSNWYNRPIAAVDRVEDDDGGETWEVRPLVSNFRAPVPPFTEILLGAKTLDGLVDLFPAFGGEPIPDGPIVLEPLSIEQDANELRVLGSASAKRRAPWLVVAVSPSARDRIKFDCVPTTLGVCRGTGHVLLRFEGRAVYNGVEGQFVWSSSAEKDDDLRLLLSGRVLSGARPLTYLGLPEFWLGSDGLFSTIRREDLFWKPRGHGEWSNRHENALGEIEFSVRQQGVTIARTRVNIVPESFAITANLATRTVILSGTRNARVSVLGAPDTPISQSETGTTLDLSKWEYGRNIALRLAWKAVSEFTVSDPTVSEVLVGPTGHPLRTRTKLSIDELVGNRVYCNGQRVLNFEIRGGRGLAFARAIGGDVPLVSFAEDIRVLLGSSGDLDQKVILSWRGGTNDLAFIGWYNLDPVLKLTSTGCEVSADGADLRLAAISLVDAKRRFDFQSQPVVDVNAGVLVQEVGPGPWLLHGKTDDGRTLRPKVLLVQDLSTPNSTGIEATFSLPFKDDRVAAMTALFSDPSSLAFEDWRKIVETITAARDCGIPFLAFDSLIALAEVPDAAVWALSFCNNLDEQSAVIGLQRELPFLWGASKINTWADAFNKRYVAMADELRNLGIPADEAFRVVAKSLAQISDLAPHLALHVEHAAIALARSNRTAKIDQALQSRLISRREIAGTDQKLRELASDSPRRADSVARAPSNLGLADRVAFLKGPWNNFVSGFHDVIAAPFVAAASAVGKFTLTKEQTIACRRAWLYDPSYFDAALPGALTFIQR